MAPDMNGSALTGALDQLNASTDVARVVDVGEVPRPPVTVVERWHRGWSSVVQR